MNIEAFNRMMVIINNVQEQSEKQEAEIEIQVIDQLVSVKAKYLSSKIVSALVEEGYEITVDSDGARIRIYSE